jgi:hypothetical protein
MTRRACHQEDWYAEDCISALPRMTRPQRRREMAALLCFGESPDIAYRKAYAVSRAKHAEYVLRGEFEVARTIGMDRAMELLRGRHPVLTFVESGMRSGGFPRVTGFAAIREKLKAART